MIRLFALPSSLWRLPVKRNAWRAAAALALALLCALPAWAAQASGPLAPPNIYLFSDPAQALVFEGKGWGHGVGLCQWGARGRALAGQSGEQIAAAYYSGTTIQQAIAPETPIRVLIHRDLRLGSSRNERITGSGGAWQIETGGAPPLQAPADAYLELTDAGSPQFTVKDPAGAPIGGGSLRGPLVLRPVDGATRFVVRYKPAGAVPGRQGAYYDAYRGELHVVPNGEGFDTINRLGLEDYLRGVVPAEMPASWPTEALKAQVLAARSYAVWHLQKRTSERFDVDDTTSFQVYLGANTEHPATNRIVEATTGQVLMHGGQVIQGVFFSTCSGWTENNESVWSSGQPLPYLRGIHDVDASGRAFDADAPRSAWATGALTVSQLEQLLNDHEATEIGKLMGMDLSARTPSGRLTKVTLYGTAGIKTIAADTLMTRFNRGRPSGVSSIFSTNFDLKWAPASAVVQAQGAMPPTPTPGPPPPTRTPAPRTTASPASSAGTAATPRAQATPIPVATTIPPPTAIPTPVYQLEMTNPVPARPSGPSNAYFQETGHNVGGAFLRFFQDRGGLDIFGFPRTEEILEDGRTVQYFQRAKLEFHIDKVGTPYEVQLSLLGDTLTSNRRPFPTVAPFTPSESIVYFPETGHSLSHAFLRFWRTRGGLDVFGYPISEEMTEDGYTVQYFQRARFEYHPELPEQYHVSLGLLGDQLLAQHLWLR